MRSHCAADLVVVGLLRVEILVDHAQVGAGRAVDPELARWVVAVVPRYVVRLRVVGCQIRPARPLHRLSVRENGPVFVPAAADRGLIGLGVVLVVPDPEHRLPLRRELELVLHVYRDRVGGRDVAVLGRLRVVQRGVDVGVEVRRDDRRRVDLRRRRVAVERVVRRGRGAPRQSIPPVTVCLIEPVATFQVTSVWLMNTWSSLSRALLWVSVTASWSNGVRAGHRRPPRVVVFSVPIDASMSRL